MAGKRSTANPRHANGNLRRKYRARLKAQGGPCGICGGRLGPIHYDEPSDAAHPLSFVVDEIKLPKISSKEFAGKLASLGASGKKNLIVTDGENENLILSARGIEGVGLVEYDNIAVYDVLYFDNLIVAKDDLKKIEEALN